MEELPDRDRDLLPHLPPRLGASRSAIPPLCCSPPKYTGLTHQVCSTPHRKGFPQFEQRYELITRSLMQTFYCLEHAIGLPFIEKREGVMHPSLRRENPEIWPQIVVTLTMRIPSYGLKFILYCLLASISKQDHLLAA